MGAYLLELVQNKLFLMPDKFEIFSDFSSVGFLQKPLQKIKKFMFSDNVTTCKACMFFDWFESLIEKLLVVT